MNWKQDAACLGLDSEIFMPSKLRGEGSKWSAKEALDICARCEVTEQCLDLSLHLGVYDGVWGGMTGTQRRKMRKQRTTGRRPGLDLPVSC